MTVAPQTHNSEQGLIEQYRAAVVVGLGVTGFSAVRYLRACGLKVRVVDSREIPPLIKELAENYPEVSIELGSFSADTLARDNFIVVSPGVALREPMLVKAKSDGAHIVGDIELFMQANRKPVIAVTGSNGKSTVTTLVGKMIHASGQQALVAGNIGRPVLDALIDGVQYDVAVLELSSFQLETLSQTPAAAAAILNISEDHMDRYDSMGDYVLAKARILRNAERAVLPRHDDWLEQITQVGEVLTFGLDEPANDAEYGVQRQSSHRWLVKGKTRLMRLRDVPLTGLHNVKNVLSAFALVDFLELPLDASVRAVREFTGLPHRMQTVLVHNDVTWVNDSKATNIGATSSALRSLEKPVIWIAGGQGKDADFGELRDVVTDNIRLLIVFGEDAMKIEAALQGHLPIQRVDDMPSAVAAAAKAAQADDVVLLSPACASFDMFSGFEQRGQVFTASVLARAKAGVA